MFFKKAKKIIATVSAVILLATAALPFGAVTAYAGGLSSTNGNLSVYNFSLSGYDLEAQSINATVYGASYYGPEGRITENDDGTARMPLWIEVKVNRALKMNPNGGTHGVDENGNSIPDDAKVTMTFNLKFDNGKYFYPGVKQLSVTKDVAEHVVGDNTIALFGYSVTLWPVSEKTKAFVNRLYYVALERDAEEAGRNYWVEQLKSGAKTGADVVNGFYMSEELAARGYSNDKLVELAYNGILNREPDANGKEYWVNKMNNGESYASIIAGFIDSDEFGSLCSDYGITKGGSSGSSGGTDAVGQFIMRLYTKALGRSYDGDGLQYWHNKIDENKTRENVLDVALNGFLHSEEFQSFNLSNEDYAKVLYRTFLGREAEEDGLNYWVNKLNSGVSRDDVARGFAYSEEFSGIMSSYGL